MYWLIVVTAISAYLSILCYGIGLHFNTTKYLRPLLGLSVIVIITSFIGFSFKFTHNLSMFLLATLTLISYLGMQKENGPEKLGSISDIKPPPPLLQGPTARSNRYTLLEISLYSIAVILGLWGKELYLNFFSTSNDSITYLIHSQWLQSHSWSDKVLISADQSPALVQVNHYQNAVNVARMGQSFLLAWIQSAFHFKWSYSAFPIAASLPVIVGSLATAELAARSTQRAFPWLAAMATAITFNGLTAGSSLGYYPQALGLAFAVGAFLLTPLTSGFCLAGIILCYPEILPFTVASLVFSSIIQGSRSKKFMKKSFELLYTLVIGTILSFFAVSYMIHGTAKAITTFGGTHSAPIGFPVPFTLFNFLSQALGLFTLDTVPSLITYGSSSLILSVIVILMAYFAITATKENGFKLISIYCFLGLLLLMFIRARFFVDATIPGEQGHTYQQWKIALWASPFLLGLSWSGLGASKYKFFKIVFLIIIIFSGIIAHYSKPYRINFENFIQVESQLRNINSPILLTNTAPSFFGSLGFTLTYFLMDKEFVGTWYENKPLYEIKKAQSKCNVDVNEEKLQFTIDCPQK